MRKSLFLTLLCIGSYAYALDWPQFGFDQSHSSNNPNETTITSANVSRLVLMRKITPAHASGGSAVYLSQVTVAGHVTDLLFISSYDGYLSAFDVNTGALIWTHSTPIALREGGYPTYESSTPVLDPDRQLVYHYGLDGKIHRYIAITGVELPDAVWPVVVTHKPDVEHGASALAVSTHTGRAPYLYAVTNGYNGDGGDYQGHVTAINLQTNASNVFNTLCSNLKVHFVENGTAGVNDCGYQRSGIWGRSGTTYDPTSDRLYLVSANGNFNANVAGGWNWGDSVLALNSDATGATPGTPIDSYTPTEYQDMELGDIDLGSGALTLLPTPPLSRYAHLGVVSGKDNLIRLINLDDMSGQHRPRAVGGELQLVGSRFVCDCFTGQNTAWADSHGDGSVWLFHPFLGSTTAYKVVVDAVGNPTLQMQWTVYAGSAGTPVIANDVLFISDGETLYAYLPTTGQRLWATPSGTYCCGLGQPLIVDGRLISVDGDIDVYALDSLFADGFDGSPDFATSRQPERR